MCNNSPLLKTQINPQTGEPILFDVWDTPEQETKRQQAAHAILDALDLPRRGAGAGPRRVALGQPAHADA